MLELILQIIGFIVVAVIIFSICTATGGLLFILVALMISGNGSDNELIGTIIVSLSAIQLYGILNFICLGNNFTLNLKKIFKERKLNIIEKEKINGHNFIKILELIVIIIVGIVAIFLDGHSLFFNFTYKNILIKILYYLFIPVSIISIINEYEMGYLQKMYKSKILCLSNAITEGFSEFFMNFLFATAFSCSVLLSAFCFFEDSIGKKVENLYGYDNRHFDEIRKQENINNEYELLNGKISIVLDNLYQQYNIDDEESHNKLKIEIVNSVNEEIKKYGYKISDTAKVEPDTIIFRVYDEKPSKYNVYKLNYRTKLLENSTEEEFTEARRNDR